MLTRRPRHPDSTNAARPRSGSMRSAGTWVSSLLLLALLALGSHASAHTQREALLDAAHAQVGVTVIYDGAYRQLDYPGGDVPTDRGVCSDVVIRAFRALGVDLQQRVHEDMQRDFGAYPALWGLTRPDRNIDHRRVPNLERYFERHGESLPPARDASAYRSGDLVTWRLPGNLPHIGIVSSRRIDDRPLIVHNVGAGAQVEDVLFAWPITAHFRYGDLDAPFTASQDTTP